MSDDQIANAFSEQPLLFFSIYTAWQVQCLERKATYLSNLLNECKSTKQVPLSDYPTEFWFWILGAYEVLRTMDQNKDCFDPELRENVRELKILVAEVRMPFAKQELRGGNPVFGELSVSGWCDQKGCLCRIKQRDFWSEELISNFSSFISSVEESQILLNIPTAQHA